MCVFYNEAEGTCCGEREEEEGEGCWPAVDADADDDSYCNVGSDWRKADRCMKEERSRRLRAGRGGEGDTMLLGY